MDTKHVKSIVDAIKSYNLTDKISSRVIFSPYKLKNNVHSTKMIGEQMYPIQKYININCEDLSSKIKANDTIYICIYNLHNFDSKVLLNINKYLEYLLYKDDKNYVFPNFKVKNENYKNQLDNFMTQLNLKKYIFGCMGYYQIDNTYYLFYKSNGKLTDSKNYTFGTMDDICNVQSIFTTKINKHVTQLFYKNYNLIYILDENYNKVEIPKTLYQIQENITDYDKLKTKMNLVLGPYNYFYDDSYINSIVDGKKDKPIIIHKYRVFIGKSKLLNVKYGEVDDYRLLISGYDNLTATTELNDYKDNSKKRLLRSSWPKNFDSLIVGVIKSSNGYNNKHPIIVTKSREQNIFISSYTI